jgi:hypothetical protein
MKIKVGYLVSYDYNMFLTSVRQLYDYVDKIFLAIDKNQKTWSGNHFEIPDSFFEEVKLFDIQNKIEFYFDSFYVPELSPMACETRERNMLLKVMGKGWLMQVDVDEYIYDFEKTAKFLKQHWYFNIFPKLTPIVFKGILVTLFKELSDGYLYIENNEKFPFITNYPSFDVCRTNYSISSHLANVKVIHQSWARSEEQMLFKIKNWGHRDDFDTQKYFEFWKKLDSTNYNSYKNIHPLTPALWDKLHFLPSSSIDDFIKLYSERNKQMLINVSFFKIVKTFYKRLLNKIILL